MECPYFNAAVLNIHSDIINATSFGRQTRAFPLLRRKGALLSHRRPPFPPVTVSLIQTLFAINGFKIQPWYQPRVYQIAIVLFR